MTSELEQYAAAWQNTNEYNDAFHAELTQKVNADPVLKAHRDWIEANQFGFGDRPFHYAWKMLVDQMPQTFSFLEVGVFKGQITSLVALLAKNEKKATVFGVTTLQNTPDMRCKYPVGNYSEWIRQIHDHFWVSQPELVVGKSTDNNVLLRLLKNKFDIVYLDGGHDLPDVVADIKNYAPKTKVGGFLVMDDASIGRLNVGSCWSGLEDVAQAVKENLDNDPRFKFLLALGHLNLFQRVSE